MFYVVETVDDFGSKIDELYDGLLLCMKPMIVNGSIGPVRAKRCLEVFKGSHAQSLWEWTLTQA